MQYYYCGWWWKKETSQGRLWQNTAFWRGMHQIGTRVKQTEVRCRTLTTLLSFPWSMDSVADRASIALQFFSRSSCFGQFQRDTTFSLASRKMWPPKYRRLGGQNNLDAFLIFKCLCCPPVLQLLQSKYGELSLNSQPHSVFCVNSQAK